MELDWSLRHVTHTTAFIAILNTEAIFPSFFSSAFPLGVFVYLFTAEIRKKIEKMSLPSVSLHLGKDSVIECRDVNVRLVAHMSIFWKMTSAYIDKYLVYWDDPIISRKSGCK